MNEVLRERLAAIAGWPSPEKIATYVLGGDEKLVAPERMPEIVSKVVRLWDEAVLAAYSQELQARSYELMTEALRDRFAQESALARRGKR